jgi:apolipoprotein N-acyltransferase
LRERVRGLRPWRAAGLAVALGVVATFALPPLAIVPALVVGFAGLLWLVDGATSLRRAALVGWCFGFGFFAVGLSWIGNAFQVDADRFGALAAPAVVGLAAGLALFIAAAAALARPAREGVPRALALAAAWSAMEWMRGHVLTGFPWNLLATAWTPVEAMEQGAAAFGAYGLGLATAIIASLPATLDRRAVLASLVLLAVLWAGGAARLAGAEATTVEGVRLRLVQAAIAQRDKWRDDLRVDHLRDQIALSRAPAARPVTHVIWPEAAIAFFLAEQPEVRAALARAVPDGGALVTGSMRRTWDEVDGMRLWNSIEALDGAGDLIAAYDKHHLVPFGEYMPLRAVVDLAKLTPGSIDFSSGPGPVVWRLPGLPPASPLVCYEAIFPGAVTPAGERPEWLLNLTNDAWFGTGPGPRQHFAAARLRSIEEGLPLVRVAGSGISAVVDPWGRVVASLDLGERGVLDADLPRPLPGATLYSRLGDAPFVMAVVALGIGAALASWRRAGA